MLHVTMALLAQLASPTALARDDRSLEIMVVDSTTKSLRAANVIKRPTAIEIQRTLPKSARSAYRIDWDCHFTKNGSIRHCEATRFYPQNINPRKFEKQIVAPIRLSPGEVPAKTTFNNQVIIIAFIDDPKRRLDFNCPPGWCPP
jgi:hypothetical protein